MFITEAKAALDAEEAGGDPATWTRDDIAALEKTLIEHETWLNGAVEKQKGAQMFANSTKVSEDA